MKLSGNMITISTNAEENDAIALRRINAELLAALARVSNWHGEFSGSVQTDMTKGEQIDFMRQVARAAILKATGGV